MPYNKQIKDNVILDSGDLQWRSLLQIAPKYIKYIYIYTLPFFQQHTVSPVKKISISITGNKNLKVDQQEKSLSYIKTQASKPKSYLEQRSNVPQFAYKHLSLRMIAMPTMQPRKHNRLQQKIGHENLQLHSCDFQDETPKLLRPIGPMRKHLWENIVKNQPIWIIWPEIKLPFRCFLIDFEWRLGCDMRCFLSQWNFGNLYIYISEQGPRCLKWFLDGPTMKGTWGGFGFPCWTTAWWWNHMKLL